jgi:starch-binding outer membrane protein, SusD/RagB family
MRFRHALAVAGLVGAAACSDFLQVDPVDQLPEERAITGATSARATVLGIYDALQDDSYYGGDFVLLTDVSSDDVDWTGTFTTYGDAEEHVLRADNGAVEGMYNAMYQAVARANLAIAQLPNLPGLDADERNELLGEAYFLRALAYHDLVRVFGGINPGDLGVPLVLTPVDDPSQAKTLRSTVAQVYTQIMTDLTAAEPLLGTNTPTRGTRGAVRALKARVELYRGNWVAAESLATMVINMPAYDLAPSHEAYFDEEGSPSPEDIFKVSFTAVDYSWEGYYYLGRYENAPSINIFEACDPNVDPGDVYNTYNPPEDRCYWDLFADEDDFLYGYKYPTTGGAEDIPVLRLAEMYLIRAEARARQGGAKLLSAVDDINVVRARAGATLLNPVGMTQQQIIDAVLHELRLEFMMEGHRWFDLRRTGRIGTILSAAELAAGQDRYPIPQSEITVVPGLQQNPGY